ncbi:MAG: hypothetical protein QM582_02920 [Micropruina sp.]|uniref:hypothetical protein n=1 Tax=Micropruina sp. TaxID=2737536 RepID=UPI0039E5A08C
MIVAKVVLASLCVPFVLVGCSTGVTPSPSVSSSERPVFTGTRTEWTQALAVCMQKKGVKATFRLNSEGAPVVAVDDPSDKGQESSPGRVAWNACLAELPEAPEPRNDTDFRAMYDHLIAQTKCVQKEGYDVPRVPSWQSFVEQARAKDVDWDPTSRVPEGLRSSVRKACIDQDKWW